MVRKSPLVLTKNELDSAIKDTKCKNFPKNFYIELHFTGVPPFDEKEGDVPKPRDLDAGHHESSDDEDDLDDQPPVRYQYLWIPVQTCGDLWIPLGCGRLRLLLACSLMVCCLFVCFVVLLCCDAAATAIARGSDRRCVCDHSTTATNGRCTTTTTILCRRRQITPRTAHRHPTTTAAAVIRRGRTYRSVGRWSHRSSA